MVQSQSATGLKVELLVLSVSCAQLAHDPAGSPEAAPPPPPPAPAHYMRETFAHVEYEHEK